MPSAFNWVEGHGPAAYVIQAILVSIIGIGLLLAFILIRRAYRRRCFQRRNARTVFLRQRWEGIVSGSVLAKTWRLDPLDSEIAESILLDQLEVAPPEEAKAVIRCLRSSGLVDIRTYEARHFRGWRRRNALLSLGRMRAPEAIPALAEGLDDPIAETRWQPSAAWDGRACPRPRSPSWNACSMACGICPRRHSRTRCSNAVARNLRCFCLISPRPTTRFGRSWRGCSDAANLSRRWPSWPS